MNGSWCKELKKQVSFESHPPPEAGGAVRFAAETAVAARAIGYARLMILRADLAYYSIRRAGHGPVGSAVNWGLGELTRTHQSATIVAMSVEPLRTVRDHLSEFVDRVEHEHERIVLTRNGHAAAVLISPEDLAQLEETIDVLSDPQALADIREADQAYARGDVIRGAEAVRRLRQ
jgi:antitoxin YefM